MPPAPGETEGNSAVKLKHKFRTRFIKSYKYKYKRKRRRGNLSSSTARQETQNHETACDTRMGLDSTMRGSAPTHLHAPTGTLLLLLLLAAGGLGLLLTAAPTEAFCPFKCHCDDNSPALSANCTQVPSISIVPMTLNPLLKRLILNQLPLSDLSNSLSIYRQLEYLNLNSNKLAQIRYQNFNFKPKPSRAISLAGAAGKNHTGGELLARHLKLTLERELVAMSATSSADSSTENDEIRHHLRELHLADNKIEQLGEQSHQQAASESGGDEDEHQRRLRAHELERMAPFLTLTKLERLDLSGNALARLHQHAFLGLLRLTRLNLARNQLEWLDRRALVGLLALEWLDLSGNRLARQQQQLAHLGRVICRGPLLELRHLNLADNSRAAQQQAWAEHLPTNHRPHAHHLVLPNEMFQCAPRLRELSLRNLRLKYLQVNAFDQVIGLERLDLSANLFDQVPLQNQQVVAEEPGPLNGNDLTLMPGGASLSELNLTGNPVEFVNANSFKGLEKLEILELNSMSQLISFDLASLASTRGVNTHLRELHVSHNKHLQAFHSSRPRPIHFERLRVLNLQGSSGLRELQLERILELTGSEERESTFLQVDLSQANQLNCSSCHMGWLVDQAKLQTGRGHQPPAVNNHHLLPPLVQPASSQLAWTPIQFDPNNLFAVPPPPPSLPPVQQAQAPQPLGGRLNLLNVDSINCAWPFSMPLVELLNLETAYAPLFNQGTCPPLAPGSQQVSKFVDPQAPAAQITRSSPQPNITTPFFGLRAGINVSAPGPLDQQGGVAAVSNSPLWTGSILLLVCILIALVKLAQLLLRRHRHSAAAAGGGFKFSPSFTVTTSLGDSPTASSSSSRGSGGGRGAPPAKRQLCVQQHQLGARPTLITSTLPDSDLRANWAPSSGGPGGGHLPYAPNWSPARNNEPPTAGHLARLGLGLRAKFQKSLAWPGRDAALERPARARRAAPSDEITFWPVAAATAANGTARPATTRRAGAETTAEAGGGARTATTIGAKMMLSPVFLSAREFEQLQREHAAQARATTARVISGGGDSHAAGEPKQSNLFSRFVGRLSGPGRRRRRRSTTESTAAARDSDFGVQWGPPTGNGSNRGSAAPFGSPPARPPAMMSYGPANDRPRVNYQVAAALLHNQQQQQQQQQRAIYGNQSAIGPVLNHYSVCESEPAAGRIAEEEEEEVRAGLDSPGAARAGHDYGQAGDQLTSRVERQQTFLSRGGIYAQRHAMSADQVVAPGGNTLARKLAPINNNNNNNMDYSIGPYYNHE